MFLRKLKPVIIDGVQTFESVQQNCRVFAEISARDNRGSSNFKLLQQNRLIFAKVLPPNNRGRTNFQATLTTLPYFCECENFPS